MAERPSEPDPRDATKIVRERLEDAMHVRRPEDIHRPAKFIKLSDLEQIVRDLVAKYAGADRTELLQRIAGLEMLSSQRQGKDEALAEAERRFAAEAGRAADLEAKLAAACREAEGAAREIAALRLTAGAEAAKLAGLIAELRARVEVLENALDYFALEEEPDGNTLRGGASAPLVERAREARGNLDVLRARMDDGQADVGTVVDLVRALRELGSVLREAEAFAAGRGEAGV
jgi:chromosome segregation ATPase